MQKELVIGLATVLLVAAPALAAPGGNGKSEDARDNHGSSVSEEKKAERQIKEGEAAQREVFVAEEPTPTVTVSLAPTASPAQTQTEKGKGNSKKAMPAGRQVQGVRVTQQETCDPSAEWKNHGSYVSCVAKTHPGGQVVSEAARSDVGKKHQPSVTPSVSPTETLTPTPPITSPETELGVTSSPLEKFFKAIGRLIQNLPFLPKNA